MKRWTGGVVILGLALLLILRHGLLLASTYAAASRHLSPSLTAAPPLVLSALLPSSRIPGLDDLFPARSFTALPPQLDSFNSSMAVWAHMRALLLRSDALPGTADGVLEASIAWKELVVSLGERIEDKEASFVVPVAAQLEKRSCPFSIGGNGNSVAIPCGFVEDSAVTLVGSPVGVNGSGRFWIQLAGSGLPHAVPFVLHYNVSFGEDGPALAQNSRTPEKGWGVWEFCPAYGFGSSESNLKVDGLVRCNEQLAESTISKTTNGSLPNSGKSHEPSKRSSQLSSGFPFIEGLPFTATLWAGMEGLHMTVNGRHETSFAYRERLEPWLISEVRVGGDLNLLSLLVNGLPISEDPDLVDMEILKAPPVLPKKRLLMLVGVFSTANNFKRRMALRRSWMQYEAVRLGSVAVRFLIGFHKHKQVNLELWREAQTYNDIQMMPFVDYYHLITLKTVATCILGTKILPAKYIMKTDDDAFVRIDEILSNLKKNTSKALLYGQISFESSPHRDADSKWFISLEEWPDEFYPPWAHGPGYIISRDIAKFIVQGHQERYLRLFKLEDVAMGIWIQEYNRSGHEVNYVNDDRFHNDGCEPNYILAHYQMPRLLLCLWEKLQKEQEATCCE